MKAKGLTALCALLILFLPGSVQSQTCTYALSPVSSAFSSQAPATQSVSVTTQMGCSWSATESLSWLSLLSGEAGTGSGTVTYSLAANTNGYARTGRVTIANQPFIVRQAKGVFSDIDQNHWAYPSIYAIYAENITTGCGNNNFCPSQTVTRGQMAAFIVRSKFGETFRYTTTAHFSDVPADHNFFKYVQKMKDEGITTVTGTYMVDQPVTRGQMAAFLVRAKFGEDFSYTTTPYFSDVPADHNFFKYVQKMKDEGITTVTGTYMVDQEIPRDQMAAFLERMFLKDASRQFVAELQDLSEKVISGEITDEEMMSQLATLVTAIDNSTNGSDRFKTYLEQMVLGYALTSSASAPAGALAFRYQAAANSSSDTINQSKSWKWLSDFISSIKTKLDEWDAQAYRMVVGSEDEANGLSTVVVHKNIFDSNLSLEQQIQLRADASQNPIQAQCELKQLTTGTGCATGTVPTGCVSGECPNFPSVAYGAYSVIVEYSEGGTESFTLRNDNTSAFQTALQSSLRTKAQAYENWCNAWAQDCPDNICYPFETKYSAWKGNYFTIKERIKADYYPTHESLESVVETRWVKFTVMWASP
jgi:hypothetical protein